LSRPAAAFTFVVTSWLVLLAGPAAAQEGIFAGMQAGVDSVFNSVTTNVTFATGAVTRTASRNFFPAFTVNFDTLIYPAWRLNTGGVFELNNLTSTTGDIRTDSTITRNRPFILLRSTSPVFSPGAGYFRREAIDRAPDRGNVKLVNDEYDAYLGWKPEGGPRSDFQFLRTNTFDGTHAVQDISKDFGSLISNYSYRNIGVNYRGSYLNTDDRVARLVTAQTSHGLRADYSRSFVNKRLLWNATYNVNHQDVKTMAHGTEGEVALAVTPFAGLSVISDTPVTATLSANSQLIDGNLTAGAGVNLGLATTPADAQLRNIGLDLLTPTAVNRFLLWVDRELPVAVSNTFSWEIYSSPDNVIWRRETTVPVAPFGDFENRFEIDFPAITARYIKLVTRPLSAVVPDSARFQDILVTELQAFIRQPASQIAGKVTQTNSLVNTDVRFRLLDAPQLFYEGSYLANATSSFGRSTSTLSNGVSANHTFGRIYSAYGRLAYEQGTEVRGDRSATVSSATFTVDPIPTFRSSFLYSGTDERVAGVADTRRGLFVQNSARPYHGIDLLFGLGWTSTTNGTGEMAHDRLVNFSATMTPLEHVSLTLNYDGRNTTRSGVFVGDPDTHEHRSYAALSFDPIPTLHLLVGGELIASTGQRTRTTLDLGASWAPFPDGTLQLIFAYDDSLRALEFGQERNTLGAVRWNVSRKSYVDVSFQRTWSATEFLTTGTRIFSVRVRFFL
jgi:hypothetical protein